MKTAMQELEDKLKDNLKWIVMNADYELMDKLFKEALEKEKDQLYHSFYGGVGFDESLDEIETLFKQYYNETYNQNK